MNRESIITTLVALLVGIWVHRNYLQGHSILFVVAGTIAFGEIFKWVTGIETLPLKVLHKTTQDLDE